MSKILGRGEVGYGILVEDDAGFISSEVSEFNNEFYDKILKEGFSSTRTNKVIVDCILQKYGVENRNGRVYPSEVLIPQVEKYMLSVKENSALSEADHPESSVVSLKNISHMIKDMWWGKGNDQNILYGKLEIITSPAYMTSGQVCMVGDKIVEYLKRGAKIGISSRGVGSLKEIKDKKSGITKNVVQQDFELICFDLVASPSTPGAYLFPKFDAGMAESETPKSESTLVTESKIIIALDDFLN